MKRLSVLLAFLWISCSLVVHAQVTQVKGKVTSAEDGSSLPGATVLVTGTNTVTVTDADGNYTINIPSDAKTLTVKFVGMATKEVPIAGQATINIALDPEVAELQEVVVTAMNITRSQKSLGYAATQVNSNELTKGSDRSALNAIQGKVAGVNISTGSGAPGASTKIILRGYSTVREQNQPLFIVDGMAINNDQVASTTTASTNPTDFDIDKGVDFGNRANDINPEDIESMSILKGAAASALYGSRAANGVVIITTKSGKASDRVKVEFTSSANLSSPLRLPQFQSTFGQGWLGWHDLTQNGSWGPKFDGKMRVWGNIVDNSQLLKPFVALKTNLADFYDLGQAYNNAVSVSGGKDNLTFYLSAGNDNEDGIVPGDVDSYKRNTLTVKGSAKGKRLSVSAGANYINKQAKYVPSGQGGSEGAVLYEDLLQTPTDISIVDQKDYKNKFYNLDNYFTPYTGNPYRILNENSNLYNEDRILGNILLEYNIAKFLKANWRVGTDVSDGQRKDWVAIAIPDLNGHNASYAPVVGRVYEKTIHTQDLNSNFYLTSENKIGENIGLNFLAGLEAVQIYSKELASIVEGLNIPYFYSIKNTSNPVNSATNIIKKRTYGIYGQAELAVKEMLFLNVTARQDYSSTLPQNNNSYFYPGVSLSYLLTEAFPNIKSVLSFGKIRASWGQTGNDANPYSVYNVFVPSEAILDFGQLVFPIGGVNAFEISNVLGNSKLKNELKTEWEIGTELRFFNNRIGVDFTYYSSRTKNLILAVPLAGSTGYTSQIQNAGEIENKGIELMFSVEPIHTSAFSWKSTVTYSQNRGKCISLAPGIEKLRLTGAYDIDYVVRPGMPLGVFEGPVPMTDGQGHVVVNESNGFPIKAAEKAVYGNSQAKYMLGFSNEFKYKNLTLSGVFDVRQGGLIYSGTSDLLYFAGNATQTLYNDRQPFVVPNSVNEVGTDANGNPIYKENSTAVDMTNMDSYYYHSNNTVSERDRVLDRSYIKLREVTLSYALPKKLFTKWPVSGINIGLTGRNLLLWTPKSNNFIDPEITTYGNDITGDFGEFRGAPTVRSFGANLRVTF